MIKVKPITWSDFKEEYKAPNTAFRLAQFATFKEYSKLKEMEVAESKIKRLGRYMSYIPFAVGHPRFMAKFVIPNLFKSFAPSANRNNSHKMEEYRKFYDGYNMRAAICKVFTPKSIFEIGTYLGVGATAFKLSSPRSNVFTINPEINKNANNPVSSNFIGYFFRKKKLKINQIWGDSREYDFEQLNKIDFIYIDGNHEYDYVYSDLKKSSEIVNKCVLIDDYIPEKLLDSDLVFGPWTEGVVRAVDIFLSKNPKIFSQAYWIEETQLCVLIK